MTPKETASLVVREQQKATHPSVVDVPDGGSELVVADAEGESTEEDAAEL